MNIFYLDTNPYNAALMACDKHVVKMTLETTQILCTVFNEYGIEIPNGYKSTHKNHPCVIWAGLSPDNFYWLLLHGLTLADQYFIRYKKIHKCKRILLKISDLYFENQHIIPWPHTTKTEIPQCMPDKYKDVDAVTAYRNYYKGEKARFAKWKLEQPEWW